MGPIGPHLPHKDPFQGPGRHIAVEDECHNRSTGRSTGGGAIRFAKILRIFAISATFVMKHILTTIIAAALALAGSVHSVAAGAPSQRAKSKAEVRTMHYFPDGRDIVCYNGDGRYTRALYGTGTLFRLETSDRPVFAVYDKERSFNFAFALDGLPLDSTAVCIARYQGGKREYELSDPAWGGGRIKMTAMASFFEEGAVWKIETESFASAPSISVTRRRIADTRMQRTGDLGIDSRDKFEASPDDPGETLERTLDGVAYCFYHHPGEVEWMGSEGETAFAREAAAQTELADRIVFDTPDPFINTIGASLTAATEGIWDDVTHTFLHGAIGWRTPLAGWRGAYAGDATGWTDRAREHFKQYLASMVTDVPPIYEHPQQDSLLNLCRAEKKWGTPMYSNGYICKLPGRNDVMNHYDMNLNLIDELLTHVGYDADPEFLRYIWPYLVLHHEWEKRNFDPDSDHLYDGYCCIWASDALYYNSGAATHSSAYNYRGNLLTARIAEIIGEDPTPYREEAEAILEAMNERLWLEDEGHWAEFQDFMGLKRIHRDAAVWSIYTPVDCEACTPEQAWLATEYVDRDIPHIPVDYVYDKDAVKALGLKLPKEDRGLETISTSDWMPYVWSTNNVAHEEVTNMALAYMQAGRGEEGFRLLKADLLDEMYLGQCPGNFGQVSYYDKSRNEAYRDFADNVGISARALVNGLFGILPDALNGVCVIKPAFPSSWKQASVKTPMLSYSFRREGHFDVYEVEQHFAQDLTVVVRTVSKGGSYLDVTGTADGRQTIRVDRRKMAKPLKHKSLKPARANVSSRRYMEEMGLSDIRPGTAKTPVDISAAFNSNVDDIYRNEYLSPRSPYTTLSLPKQGVGEWCIPTEMHEIEDDGFRAAVKDGIFDTGLGVQFLSPAEGLNIAYTSLWDNYPSALTVPLEGRARAAYLLMAGSTCNMQSRIDNGLVTVTYTDGTSDTLRLLNPINWCSVEQDYYTDDYAFWTAPLHPYRVLLSSGETSRDVSVRFLAAAENDLQLFDAVKVTDRGIPDGAAQILRMPLKKSKELQSLTLTTLSNDVVTGLMAVTLED